LDISKQVEVLKKNVVDLITEEDLKAKLEKAKAEGRPLRLSWEQILLLLTCTWDIWLCYESFDSSKSLDTVSYSSLVISQHA